MRKETRATKTDAGVASTSRPYSPSWFDLFASWVERLPGPPWLFYLALAIVLALVGSAIQWIEGAYPFGTLRPLHLWTVANSAYLLALMHYLDRSAATSLTSFRPLLSDAPRARKSRRADTTFSHLLYQLTTMPRGPAALSTLAGVLFTVIGLLTLRGLTPTVLVGTALTPLSTATMLILFAPSNAILFLLFYHSIRQLRLVSRTYSTLGHVDIYRLEPLYALSAPGALTAIGLIVLAYLWSALSPAQSQQPAAIGLALTATGFTIAVVAFALPFWGAHRQLVFEKASALAEASSRFRATTIQLHRDLDRGRLREMDQLHKALASLEIEQNAIRKVSTWPSQLVAVRSLLAALLLPILIWAIQQALGRLIGP